MSTVLFQHSRQMEIEIVERLDLLSFVVHSSCVSDSCLYGCCDSVILPVELHSKWHLMRTTKSSFMGAKKFTKKPLLNRSDRHSMRLGWSISNFPCSLTRNITTHSIENVAFHRFTQRKDDFATNSHYLTYTFLFKRLGVKGLRIVPAPVLVWGKSTELSRKRGLMSHTPRPISLGCVTPLESEARGEWRHASMRSLLRVGVHLQSLGGCQIISFRNRFASIVS